MGGRLEAAHRQALMTGWYTGVFHRMPPKQVKPLAYYLAPRKRGGGEGARRVMDMMRHFAAQQDQGTDNGIG